MTTSSWTTSWPTAPGAYWCYNRWRRGSWHLDYAQVFQASNALITVRAGEPVDPAPDHDFFWMKIDLPQPPDVSTLPPSI